MHGSGRTRLFEPGQLVSWGKEEVTPTAGKFVDILVSDPGTTEIAAAAWWPEKIEFNPLGYPLDTHNDIEIELFAPGSTVAEPYTPHFDGVFARVVANVGGRLGTWQLNIVPKNVVTTSQTVFWAMGLDPVTPAIASASQNATSSGCGCACSP
jgi:hypothetical protein